MNQSPDITIIVPFLNEEDNIERLGAELNRFTGSKPDIQFEVILVNDGSTDSSVNVIKNTTFATPTKVISFSQNYGSHAALRAGIMHSKGKHVTFLYADLQDPIENIATMYSKEMEGNDIIWANRSGTQNSFFERQFSKFYSRLMKKYVNKRYPTKGFDVVLFNRKVADAVNKNVEGNSSVFLQILNLGFKQDFVEYQKAARQAGKSKWTLAKKIKLLIDSFVAFSFAPIRMVSMIGILFFLAGLLWTGYIFFRKIFFDDLPLGWPALMSISMLGFGITNISLGIIAEYLWRTLDASRKRPVFIIDEIIEIKEG
ncbi:MAG: glycosyltransferase family 2 protein [Chitinophagaceae bacterium]